MATIAYRKCSCGEDYEVLTHNGETVNMSDAVSDAICPVCKGEEFSLRVVSGTGIELGDVSSVGKLYPYFDRGLGMQVNSSAHRKKICKERNLIPVDGTMDNRDLTKAHAQEDEIERRYSALKDKYNNDPQFADYRRLRDKGFYEDEAKRQRERS